MVTLPKTSGQLKYVCHVSHIYCVLGVLYTSLDRCGPSAKILAKTARYHDGYNVMRTVTHECWVELTFANYKYICTNVITRNHFYQVAHCMIYIQYVYFHFRKKTIYDWVTVTVRSRVEFLLAQV